MKSKFRFIISLSLISVLIFIFQTNVFASAKGFGIYHNHAFGISPYWHTGMMLTDSPDIGFSGSFQTMGNVSQTLLNTDYSVVHLSSASNSDNASSAIHFCNFDDFLNNKDFMGFFTASSNPNEAQRNTILSIAKQFYNYTVQYRALNQIDYSVKYFTFNGTIVYPNEVTKFRCDGFLEYCYERCNFRVFGTDATNAENWNITYDCILSRNIHNPNSLLDLSPNIQAQNMKCTLGDVDADGTISVSDARLALRYAINLETPNDYQKFAADVMGDNEEITVDDANLINRAAIGLEGNGIVSNIGTNIGYRFPNDPFYST